MAAPPLSAAPAVWRGATGSRVSFYTAPQSISMSSFSRPPGGKKEGGVVGFFCLQLELAAGCRLARGCALRKLSGM